MSIGKPKSKSKQTSTSTSTSNPLNPDDVAGYFTKLNDLTGGRLNTFAQNGTQPVSYDAPTDAQIQSLGGLGATQRRDVQSARDQVIQQLTADPSLTTFQRLRSNQLTNQDAQSRLDAIDQETQAAITNAAMQRAQNKYNANVANAGLTSKDLALLAEIFFGGKGQTSSSSSNSTGTFQQNQTLSDYGKLSDFANFGFKF